MKNWKGIFWASSLTILGIVCFPANPLVLTGVIDVKSYLSLSIVGWVVWVFGMILVMAPLVMVSVRGNHLSIPLDWWTRAYMPLSGTRNIQAGYMRFF